MAKIIHINASYEGDTLCGLTMGTIKEADGNYPVWPATMVDLNKLNEYNTYCTVCLIRFVTQME